MNRFYQFLFGFLLSLNVLAQPAIQEVTLNVDTLTYTLTHNQVEVQGQQKLYFQYDQDDEIVDVIIDFESDESFDLSLLYSDDFNVIDSLLLINNQAFFKVRFSELTNREFLKFRMSVIQDSTQSIIEIPLQPVFPTFAEFSETDFDLYIGEEKSFELITNNPENLYLERQWNRETAINHRFGKSSGEWNLHVLPTGLGVHQLPLQIRLKKPFINETGDLSYSLDPIDLRFDVKEGRLVFLQIDKDEVTPNDDSKEPILVQIENHRLLRLQKTYRIEDREEIGGPLVGELFTRSRLTNDRVLCEFRPYAFHKRSDGYLYIKDGDEPRFVTNVEISPKTSIDNISIQREGRDWEVSNTLYPGENVNVRLTGVGLHKANISFGGIRELGTDSLIRNENMAIFNLTVPPGFQRKTIDIFNWNQPTGKKLQVKEFQLPRNFDFVNLDLGTKTYNVDEINRPIYFEDALPDLLIEFDRAKIDENNDFHGVQYLDLEIKIYNKAGSLQEIHRINDYGICPAANSPRSDFYDAKDCKSADININTFLNKKTYDLEEWSRIEITVNHNSQKYSSGQQQKKLTIYLKRRYNFDIDVSFPAGLLILKSNEVEDENGVTTERSFTNFSGGISFAMIAQFSFYQEGKIAKYKPYKIGAGFIAIDALNFSENSDNRDVALVVLGSLYPISSDRKLTFPLYTGFGFLLREAKPFFLVGPGIRVRF